MAVTKSMTVEVNGKTYAGEVGVVKDTHLGPEDHGPSINIHLAFGASEQGTGHYPIGTHVGADSGYSIDLILQLIEIIGGRFGTWEKLKGKQVIALYPSPKTYGDSIVGLASVIDDKALVFKDHATEWMTKAR